MNIRRWQDFTSDFQAVQDLTNWETELPAGKMLKYTSFLYAFPASSFTPPAIQHDSYCRTMARQIICIFNGTAMSLWEREEFQVEL